MVQAIRFETTGGPEVLVWQQVSVDKPGPGQVRLKHKATGKPVTDAVIAQTRIDMSPDAMAEMASPLTPVPSNEPGVYSFKTDLSMQGRWLLSIAAKVQGEAARPAGP